MKEQVFFAPGKLMLTGEYVVFNGVEALALPTGRFGQSLMVQSRENGNFHAWKSFEKDKEWFSSDFSLDLSRILQTNDIEKARFLQEILKYIKNYKPALFEKPAAFTTRLNFNRQWGWGSSSTLLVLLYQWSGVNPFVLNRKFYGGSGYDIAVGMENKALIYKLNESPADTGFKMIPPFNEPPYPSWQTLQDFDLPFKADLKLVYLGKKQSSANEIKKYKPVISPGQKEELNRITRSVARTTNLDEFRNLMNRHEQILSTVLGRPTIKEELFSGFKGMIKSLGAWGGDFVLASGKNTEEYFRKKGLETIFDFDKVLI